MMHDMQVISAAFTIPFWMMCHCVTRLRSPTAALSSLLTTSGHSASSTLATSSSPAQRTTSTQKQCLRREGLSCAFSSCSWLMAQACIRSLTPKEQADALFCIFHSACILKMLICTCYGSHGLIHCK